MAPDNPLALFRFCPLCGADEFVEHAENARRCTACGFTYYTNPRGATVAIIRNDCDELLVATRANDPGRGMLDMVGGFMDLRETAEEGLCREVLEETGLVVAPADVRYLLSQPNIYPYGGITLHTIDLFFEVRVAGRPALCAQDDVAHLQWIPLSALRIEDFAFASIRKGLTAYLEKNL